jgi:uncharacterized membrane protein YccC
LFFITLRASRWAVIITAILLFIQAIVWQKSNLHEVAAGFVACPAMTTTRPRPSFQIFSDI